MWSWAVRLRQVTVVLWKTVLGVCASNLFLILPALLGAIDVPQQPFCSPPCAWLAAEARRALACLPSQPASHRHTWLCTLLLGTHPPPLCSRMAAGWGIVIPSVCTDCSGLPLSSGAIGPWHMLVRWQVLFKNQTKELLLQGSKKLNRRKLIT